MHSLGQWTRSWIFERIHKLLMNAFIGPMNSNINFNSYIFWFHKWNLYISFILWTSTSSLSMNLILHLKNTRYNQRRQISYFCFANTNKIHCILLFFILSGDNISTYFCKICLCNKNQILQDIDSFIAGYGAI